MNNNPQHDFNLTMVDTDSVMFCRKDGKPFTEEEQDALLAEINSILPEMIKMDHDGYFPRVCILKAKNYILQPEDKNKKLIMKGSALKDAKKEPALKEFLNASIDLLLKGRKDRIFDLYEKYCREVVRDEIDISRWVTKKNITEAVLKKDRTPHNQKVFDALQGVEYSQGDKFYMYFDTEDKLKISERYAKDHNKMTLLDKIHATLETFSTVIDTDLFPKYTLARNKDLLDKLLQN